MESALFYALNLVALCLAVITLLAAITVGFGDVKALRHPMARVLITPVLAVLGLWILFFGIHHMVSG
jgi:hypothetical protein